MAPVVHHKGASLGPTVSPFLLLAYSLSYLCCLYTWDAAVFVFRNLASLPSMWCTYLQWLIFEIDASVARSGEQLASQLYRLWSVNSCKCYENTIWERLLLNQHSFYDLSVNLRGNPWVLCMDKELWEVWKEPLETLNMKLVSNIKCLGRTWSRH